MGKMHYIIDKQRGMVTAQHETRALCEQHLRNAQSLFGNDPKRFHIAEGTKVRDEVLKHIKNGTYFQWQAGLHNQRMAMNERMDNLMT